MSLTHRDIQRLTAGLFRRIVGTVSRGIVTADDDSGGRQTLQVKGVGGELRQVERFQQFGFSARAPVEAKTEAIVLSVAGDRGHAIGLTVESRAYRPTNLKSGEAILYTSDGTTIHLQLGGAVEVTTSTKVRLVTPLLQVTGDIIDHCDDGTGRTLKSLRDDYNRHTHNAPGGGGATSAPSVID